MQMEAAMHLTVSQPPPQGLESSQETWEEGGAQLPSFPSEQTQA